MTTTIRILWHVGEHAGEGGDQCGGFNNKKYRSLQPFLFLYFFFEFLFTYNFNLGERRAKYQDYDHVLICSKCNQRLIIRMIIV